MQSESFRPQLWSPQSTRVSALDKAAAQFARNFSSWPTQTRPITSIDLSGVCAHRCRSPIAYSAIFLLFYLKYGVSQSIETFLMIASDYRVVKENWPNQVSDEIKIL